MVRYQMGGQKRHPKKTSFHLQREVRQGYDLIQRKVGVDAFDLSGQGLIEFYEIGG